MWWISCSERCRLASVERPRKTPPPEVGQVLTALGRRMRYAGLTGEDIARRLGWTGDYARQVLNGRVKLRYQHVTQLLGALGVHPVEFFEEIFGPPPGRPARLPAAGVSAHATVGLFRWSGLHVFVAELQEKGIFTAEEAARLLEKLDGAALPPEE